MSLPRDAMGLSAVCDCGIPWSYSLLLIGGCTGSSESTLVKMQHCWKSHVGAQMRIARYTAITDHRTTHGTLKCKKILLLNTNQKFVCLMSAEDPYILRNISKLLVALFSEMGRLLI